MLFEDLVSPFLIFGRIISIPVSKRFPSLPVRTFHENSRAHRVNVPRDHFPAKRIRLVTRRPPLLLKPQALDSYECHSLDELFYLDPTIKQAHINLGHFKTEQIQRNAYSNLPPKDAANNKNKKKEDFMFTYERLCRGESRKVSSCIKRGEGTGVGEPGIPGSNGDGKSTEDGLKEGGNAGFPSVISRPLHATGPTSIVSPKWREPGEKGSNFRNIA